jgi:hypothetical protein
MLIDMEHSPNGLESVLAQLQAVAAYPITPVVRVPIGDVVTIKQVLDLGAQTLLVPMISTAAEARAVVEAVHYPPRGRRGVGSALARSGRWNRVDDYPRNAGEHVCLLVQIETTEGVENAADIAGVDGFAGITMHTARWDHSQDLTGKRVAIIGTGASAVQVIPEIAPIVAQLNVFQRTPIWCMPKLDVPLPAAARWAMRIPGGKVLQRVLSQAYVELTFTISAQYYTVFPLANRAEKMGRAYLNREVHDPEYATS